MVYMGSKSRLSKFIIPYIEKALKYFDNGVYIEPFVGGANLICKVNAPYKFGLDNNKYLIALLNYCKNSPPNKLPDYQELTFEEYQRVKDNKDDYPDWYVGLIGFICTYRAKFFGGYCHGGKTEGRNYVREHLNNITKQIPSLRECDFICKDYKDLDVRDAVIYCDPPYKNRTGYNSKSFDYEEYYEWLRKNSEKNIILCSEYEMPQDFISIDSFKVINEINHNNKTIENEKLFTIGLGKNLLYSKK